MDATPRLKTVDETSEKLAYAPFAESVHHPDGSKRQRAGDWGKCRPLSNSITGCSFGYEKVNPHCEAHYLGTQHPVRTEKRRKSALLRGTPQLRACGTLRHIVVAFQEIPSEVWYTVAEFHYLCGGSFRYICDPASRIILECSVCVA